jgi:hypothetical protein
MGTIEAPRLWRDIRSDRRVMWVSRLRLPSEKNRASTKALKVIRLALQNKGKKFEIIYGRFNPDSREASVRVETLKQLADRVGISPGQRQVTRTR